jgi:hypothetical protein
MLRIRPDDGATGYPNATRSPDTGVTPETTSSRPHAALAIVIIVVVVHQIEPLPRTTTTPWLSRTTPQQVHPAGARKHLGHGPESASGETHSTALLNGTSPGREPVIVRCHGVSTVLAAS